MAPSHSAGEHTRDGDVAEADDEEREHKGDQHVAQGHGSVPSLTGEDPPHALLTN